MVTLTRYELLVVLIIMFLIGYTIWDMIWAVIVPDAQATSHFARASWKQRVIGFVIITLAILAIIGWAY